MSTKLDQAVDAIRKLPTERQDELAETLVMVAQMPASTYTTAQRAAIDEGIADAASGRFVTDEELQATFARFRTV